MAHYQDINHAYGGVTSSDNYSEYDDEDVMSTGKFIVNKTEKLTSADGTDRWVFVTKIPRFDLEGNIIGTMGISGDINLYLPVKN